MTMITTRNINVDLAKGQKKLVNRTTKDVDASIRIKDTKQSKIKQKPVALQTANLPDVELAKDKKRRDDIMEQRNLYLKDKKKLKINESNKKTEDKAWKDMTEAERQQLIKKQINKEKMAKVRAAKKKVKK